ncbi:MAG: hypothetical protein HDT01_01280 [Bacteroidales bacterium]|nr:hypothetical protein [Bacteroidales bacterium]
MMRHHSLHALFSFIKVRCMFMLLATLAGVVNVNAADNLDGIMPSRSQLLVGYNNIDSVRHTIDTRGAVDIEGIWQLSSGQTTVVIEPCSESSINNTGLKCLQIVVISSPRRSIRPGTVLGYISPTARAGYYDARLYTDNVRSLLQRHRRFTLKLSDEGHLSMEPVKQNWKLNLRHTFNFLFRASVTSQATEDNGTEGFSKLYPLPGIKPLAPVYL